MEDEDEVYLDPYDDDAWRDEPFKESPAEKLAREKKKLRDERRTARAKRKERRVKARAAAVEERNNRKTASFNKFLEEEEEKKGLIQSLSVTFENDSNVTAQCVLFGCNRNGFTENFGSAKGVKISSNVDGGYLSLLNISNAMPMVVEKWIFNCENREQFRNDLMYFQYQPNGMVMQSPFTIGSPDPFQFQNTLIAVNRKMVVNGNTEFKFDLLPETTLTITMYPEEVTMAKTNLPPVSKRGRPKAKVKTKTTKQKVEEQKAKNKIIKKEPEPLNSHTATNVITDFLKSKGKL